MVKAIDFQTTIYVDHASKEDMDYRHDLVNTQDINIDRQIEEQIEEDIASIYESVGYQDGMYENFPFTRVLRGENSVRVYALDSGGGVAIIQKGFDKHWNEFRIITLGEDDGYFFPRGRYIHESFIGVKQDFVWALSEALSLFNQVKL